MKETRIIYILLGFAFAWAILATYFLRASVFTSVEFLFHQRIESEEFQKDLDRRIEEAAYRIYEIEKQKSKINTGE